MARTTPFVNDTTLTNINEGGQIVVGTPAWYAWLEGATTFAFTGRQGNFTARKEQRGATGSYWKAYRRRAGKLYNAYLGKSEDLSFERLAAVALDLTTRDATTPPAVASGHEPSLPSWVSDAGGMQTLATDHRPLTTGAADVTDNTSLANLLLTTKLGVPSTATTLVPRPRLVARLNAGLEALNGKLTMVSAPAGWGKSTLLSSWCSDIARRGPSGSGQWPVVSGQRLHTTRVTDHGPMSEARARDHWVRPAARVAWVSLDASDNDPIRFWTYVISALNTLYAGAGNTALALLRSPQAPTIETVLTTLVNALSPSLQPNPDTPTRAILVLDDYHIIDAQPIHGGLTFLLENLPPHLHLVIASRADPPLPLARLRASGSLTELRATDLRFTPEEAAIFLRETVGLRLSPEDVTALDERTEGWIAGLQLAALAMRDRDDISSFIAGFTGSSRFIIDYLAEEVLERQTEEVRAFLLRTSILESMCAPLCAAVMGADAAPTRADLPPGASQTMLEQLEHANLFITALDDERVWYRYHRLFADVLQAHLRRERPDLPPALYLRAAEWCEGEALVSEALHYAVASGNQDYAARIIETRFEAMLLGLGDFATVRSLLAMLPQALVTARPMLALAYATANLITHGMPSVKSYLGMAEQALSGPPSLDSVLQGRINAVRGFLAVRYGEWQSGSDLLKEALETLPGDDAYRGLALYALGRLYLVSGPRSSCGPTFAQAVEFNRRNGYTMLTILSLNGVAAYQTLEGRLHDAAATCREGLLLAERQGVEMVATAVNLNTRLSLYHYEWDDLDNALRYARSARQIARALEFSALFTTITDLIAQILYAQGDPEGARLALLEGAAEGAAPGVQIASTPRPPTPSSSGAPGNTQHTQRPPMLVAARVHHQSTAPATMASQQVMSGDLQRALELGLTANDEPIPQYEVEYLALARRLLDQPDKRAEGFRLLDRLLELGEANGDTGSIIAALALQAIGLASQGRQTQALGLLQRALKLGEPGGYVRTFIDEGRPMEALLRMATKQGVAPEYAEKLLSHFATHAAHMQSKSSRYPIRNNVEPLTARELEVLRLIVGGASNRDIAEALIVTIGTVKRHTNSLYGKLGAGSRTQAVARAHELHLV